MKTDEYRDSAGRTDGSAQAENYQNTNSTSPAETSVRVLRPIIPARKPKSQPRPSVQDLLCFSHLRWNFVYQRPQHLMSRATGQYRVWFIEEPIWEMALAWKSGPSVTGCTWWCRTSRTERRLRPCWRFSKHCWPTCVSNIRSAFVAWY